MKINWELNIVFFFEVFYSPIQVLQVGGGMAAWQQVTHMWKSALHIYIHLTPMCKMTSPKGEI